MDMIAGGGRLGLIAVRVRMRARMAVALLLLLGSAGGVLAAGMGSASAQPSPSLARGRALPAGAGDYLYGIRCTSAASCWAVGNTSDNLTEALHWNGHQWSQVTTPNPGDYSDNLDDVACTSAADCWAVGTAGYSDFTSPNLALHWNGHTWSVVSTPSPHAGEGFNELLSVTCVSPRDCWAVGLDSDSGQALHWNGHRWSLVPTPGTALRDVRCISSANCWAVGPAFFPLGSMVNEAMHWNGHTWSYVTMPSPAPGASPDLEAIACTSSSNCWAVGFDGRGDQVLHWNGHHWSTA